MAVFTRIKEASAPPRPSTLTSQKRRMADFDAYLQSLVASSDSVGLLEPEGRETARGLSMRVRRAAARLGLECEVWRVDDSVYFKVSSPPPQKRSRLQLGKA